MTDSKLEELSDSIRNNITRSLLVCDPENKSQNNSEEKRLDKEEIMDLIISNEEEEPRPDDVVEYQRRQIDDYNNININNNNNYKTGQYMHGYSAVSSLPIALKHAVNTKSNSSRPITNGTLEDAQYLYCWDPGSQVTIYCSQTAVDQMEPITDTRGTVTGIGGIPVKYEYMGWNPILDAWGYVDLKHTNPFNIVSQTSLAKTYRIETVRHDPLGGKIIEIRYRHRLNNRKYLLFRMDNAYYPGLLIASTINFGKLDSEDHCMSGIGVLTPTEQQCSLPNSAIIKARTAKKIIQNVGFPSLQSLKQFILHDCHNLQGGDKLKPQDFNNAIELYGDVIVFKGKATKPNPPIRPVGITEEYEQYRLKPQTLYMDLIFWRGVGMLISIAKPLGLITTDLPKSKSKQDLIEAIARHINKFRVQGFQVQEIFFDAEKSLGTTDEKFSGDEFNDVSTKLGVKFTPRVAGDHVHVIERLIRTVKDRLRCIDLSKPFGEIEIPMNLVAEEIEWVADRINAMRSSVEHEEFPPREIFYRRKFDISFDAAFAFGDIAQTIRPLNPQEQRTEMDRSEDVIMLRPSADGEGWWAFNPTTNKRYRRHIRSTGVWGGIQRLTPAIKAAIQTVAVKSRGLKGRLNWEYHLNTIQKDDFDSSADTKNREEFERKFISTDDDSKGKGEEGANNKCGFCQRKEDAIDERKDPSRDSSHRMLSKTKCDRCQRDVDAIDRRKDPSRDSSHRMLSKTKCDRCQRDVDAIDEDRDPYKELNDRMLSTNKKISSMPGLGVVRSEINHSNQKEMPFSSLESKYTLAATIRTEEAFVEFGKEETIESTRKEVTQIVERGTLKPTHMSDLSSQQRQKIISTLVLHTGKRDSRNNFIKLKTRVCARGDLEDKSTYESLYAPTVNQNSVLSLLAIAAYENRYLEIIDLVGAFLYIDVVEGSETYVEFNSFVTEILIELRPQWKEFVGKEGKMICLLGKSLYGICQAPSNLYRDITKTVTDLGFLRNPKDPCVFNKVVKGTQITLLVFVDDIGITCTDQALIEDFISKFKIQYKDIVRQSGPVCDYLGMTVDMTEKGKCKLSMKGYFERATLKFSAAHHMVHEQFSNLVSRNPLKKRNSPSDEKLHHIDLDSPELSESLAKEFVSLVMTYFYAARKIRFEMLAAVAFLSTRMREPTVQDWTKLQMVASYCSSTADRCKVLQPESLNIECQADAAFAVDQEMLSVSGLGISVGGSFVIARSYRQKLVARSSCEAEIMCLSDAVSFTIYMIQFMQCQGYGIRQIPIIWQDNKAVITLLQNNKPAASNSRHFKIHWYFAGDYMRRKELDVKYLPTKLMIADILTKGMAGDNFHVFGGILLGDNIEPYLKRRMQLTEMMDDSSDEVTEDDIQLKNKNDEVLKKRLRTK
jgi:hypothetical protein